MGALVIKYIIDGMRPSRLSTERLVSLAPGCDSIHSTSTAPGKPRAHTSSMTGAKGQGKPRAHTSSMTGAKGQFVAILGHPPVRVKQGVVGVELLAMVYGIDRDLNCLSLFHHNPGVAQLVVLSCHTSQPYGNGVHSQGFRDNGV
ncbi:unnamed protein product [Oppiella nova]|uniref:Uncharacterized protein n=1 Tax=Oppiella nova TaxID=334625 RepID=A0A7R9LT54_9ACAR|nr:unnamed protein product [Oppiella nova]CAG2166376.1 unnamed protein product [Oppiella nova]